MSSKALSSSVVARDTVLIVDDRQTNREILKEMLLQSGFKVLLAADGAEAVEVFAEHLPGTVLMDIVMPRMDGIEATRQIKALMGSTFVPVIMISGLEDEETIRRSIDAGGDDFIRRPFSLEVLRAKVRAFQRISTLYSEVQGLYSLRRREEEVAEQIFSDAVESGNVATDQVGLCKRAAETFSGDVLLTAWRPNGDLNILLGDFTGHGLSSVVGALPLAETFRAMTRKGYEAEEILQQINRKLHALLPTGMFLAAAMVTAAREGNYKVWNGGMPDVLVLSGDGEVKQRVISGDPPLGIVGRLSGLTFTMVNLAKTDRILLLSDGVIEARNGQDEYFGETRLLWAVRQGCQEGALINRVMRSVDMFLKQNPQDDDISLIEIPGRIKPQAEGRTHLPAASAFFEPVSEKSAWQWSLQLQGNNLKTVNPVAIALSHLQEVEGPSEHWHHVFTVLTELYVNALDHGVLQLSSSLKSTPEGFSEYFKEREARLGQLKPDQYVRIQLSHQVFETWGSLRIQVKDSGAGFNYRGWLEKVSARAQSAEPMFSGRGIVLISELCHALEYSDDGSLALAEYRWSLES